MKSVKIIINIDKTNNNLNKLTLRTVNETDIENLRVWKNMNKNFFFYKQEISESQQTEWFNQYLNRPDDYIFIVELNNQLPIGCMGIRKLDKEWDAYNIILGESEFGRKGYMSVAFKKMLDFASNSESLPITLKVLKENPAVSWYEKNGFKKMSIEDSHFYMKYISQS
jgi:RimJ/RimL family protein N-acetyltransferase